MRKPLILFLLLLGTLSGRAATYFWIGGASGNWTTLSNWSYTSGGTAAPFYPAANDAVVFDNSLNINLTYDLPGNDIGFASFQVKNNTQLTMINVVIPATGNTRSFTVNSSFSSSYFEVVAAGSSLSLKSNTNTIFSLGSDNLSSGRMVFNGQVYCIIQDNFNTSAGPRLNASTDSIIINDLFYIGPSITSTGINPIGSKFRFGSNGIYQIDKDGGIYLFAKWASGSLIKITGTRNSFPGFWNGFYPANHQLGGFEIDAPNATAAAIANLNIPSSGPLIFQNDFKITNLGTSAGIRLSSAPNLTIQGNLLISNGNVSLAGSSTSNASIIVNGNLIVSPGATVDFQALSATTQLKVGGQVSVAGTLTELGTSTSSALELNGTAPQSIDMPGIISNDVSLTVNNSSGVTALSDINLSPTFQARLNLTSGNLNALANNKIIYVRNPLTGAINGGSASSHIIGKLKRASNSNGIYDFPVSDNVADLARVSLTPAGSNTTDWAVEFIRSNPNAGTGLPSGIASVSPYRWEIIRSGSSPSNATLVNFKYASITGNGISNPASVQVLRWNSAGWDPYGGNYDNAGGINTVVNPVTHFGTFSFGFASATVPVLTASVLNTFGNICVNSTVGPNSIVLTGSNLSAGNIIVGPLTGFSFSLTAGGVYSNTLSISHAGGNLAATNVYVKFSPTAAQSYNGNIPVSGAGAAAISVPASGSGINPVPPEFTQISAICTGSALNPLPTQSNNGISGTWAPAPNNTQTTIYTFTPAAGACASIITMTITVSPLTTPSFSPLDPVCAGSVLNPLPATSNNGISGSWSPAPDNTQTTTYTFTPSVGSCATTTTLTLTVIAPPDILIQPADISVCNGETVNLVVSATGAVVSYQWQRSEDEGVSWINMNGATNTSYSINNITSSYDSALYRVLVNGASPCGTVVSDSARILIKDDCVNAFIYPNPAPGGNFFINVPLPNNSDLRVITIFDAKGALVFRKSFNTALAEIRAGNLSRGAYLVMVRDRFGSKLRAGKVIISSN